MIGVVTEADVQLGDGPIELQVDGINEVLKTSAV
jgi:hypothetical protein